MAVGIPTVIVTITIGTVTAGNSILLVEPPEELRMAFVPAKLFGFSGDSESPGLPL